MVGRPKNSKKSIAKTYSFYEEDIDSMLNTGLPPKEIFRLGILAHSKGWRPHKEASQNIELKERVSKLALMLNTYTEKFNRLCVVVEKGLNIRIDPELSNVHELETKIDNLLTNDNKIKSKIKK